MNFAFLNVCLMVCLYALWSVFMHYSSAHPQALRFITVSATALSMLSEVDATTKYKDPNALCERDDDGSGVRQRREAAA
jgi:hypothetical protein